MDNHKSTIDSGDETYRTDHREQWIIMREKARRIIILDKKTNEQGTSYMEVK